MQASYIRESERLTALDRYDILDTPPEEAFDRITRLTRSVFDVSMATISLPDGYRQWFKSRQGFHSCETSRGMALCDYTIRESVPLVIPDTLADERYREHPSVTGDPHVRFYAGAQLRVTGGHNIGTLCAFDTRPRGFSTEEAAILQDLARIVLSELELRTLLMQDSLTGALSRRALRDETTRAITLATRHGHHLSLIMFDLDHFKAINDNNGHHVGDRVLAAASTRSPVCAPSRGCCARQIVSAVSAARSSRCCCRIPTLPTPCRSRRKSAQRSPALSCPGRGAPSPSLQAWALPPSTARRTTPTN